MLGYDSISELMTMGNSGIFSAIPWTAKIAGEYLLDGLFHATVEWKRHDGKLITVRLNSSHGHGSEYPILTSK